MSLSIEYPLSQRATKAVVAAAYQIGCEPWEVAQWAIQCKQAWAAKTDPTPIARKDNK